MAKSRSNSKKMTRSARDQQIIAKKARMHKRIREEMGTPRCGPGRLVKEGYVRKSYTRKSGSRVKSAKVAPTCMPARGRTQKGKQLFVLEKGTLGKYGYHDVEHMSTAERREALTKAMQHESPLAVFHKLNAVYVVNKNFNPASAKIFLADKNWIETTPEYANRPSAIPKRIRTAIAKSKSKSISKKSKKSRKSRK